MADPHVQKVIPTDFPQPPTEYLPRDLHIFRVRLYIPGLAKLPSPPRCWHYDGEVFWGTARSRQGPRKVALRIPHRVTTLRNWCVKRLLVLLPLPRRSSRAKATMRTDGVSAGTSARTLTGMASSAPRVTALHQKRLTSQTSRCPTCSESGGAGRERSTTPRRTHRGPRMRKPQPCIKLWLPPNPCPHSLLLDRSNTTHTVSMCSLMQPVCWTPCLSRRTTLQLSSSGLAVFCSDLPMEAGC